MQTSLRWYVVALFVATLFGPVPASGQAGNIIGLPPQALERLPGAARLFEVANASGTPEIRDHAFRLGEVVARFGLGMTYEDVERVARSAGAERIERFSPLGLFLLHGRAASEAQTRSIMDRLWRTGKAVEIKPNYIGELNYVPNDPHHVSGAQWYHESASDIDLDLRSAWDVTRGSTSVVVAVIDTGVDVDHPEFVGRYYVNPGEIPANGLDDDDNGYVDDVSGWNTLEPNGNVNDTTLGHGTWVASVLLANTDNSHQVAGFDHSVRLLPLKALDGLTGDEIHLQAALDYLLCNPGIANIVSMSLANYDDSHVGLGNSLSAVALDSILIGGSGNNGAGDADNGYPESHPDVITIGGTDQNDDLAFFPSNGMTAGTGDSVDFSAPAVDIYVASWLAPSDPNAFQILDGTSLATPMVSAIATLALSVWPTMTKAELIEILRASAVDLGAPGKDPEFGWGRVNAHEALLAIPYIFGDGFESGGVTAWSTSFP